MSDIDVSTAMTIIYAILIVGFIVMIITAFKK